MTVAEKVSREDFDAVVRAVSDVVSGFCPGSSLQTVERTYHTWGRAQPSLICEVELKDDVPVLYQGVAPKSTGWGEARRRALEDMSRSGGWPLAFSGDEMRLLLSLRSERELRELSRRCAIPGLSMLKTTPAEDRASRGLILKEERYI